MTDRIEGFLEVGINEKKEVVVNHTDLKPDADGVGHIVFSPAQARALAFTLIRKAEEAALSDEARVVKMGWESGPVPVVELFTLEPDDPDGLPGEKCFLVKLTVPMISWPVRKDGTRLEPEPPGLILPQRWKQAVNFKVGLFSGMWSVAENGEAPVTTVLLPR